MKDIAKVCDVSQAVVSKALANRPGVSAQTRDRVLEVARQFNYRPNELVRSLQRGQTMTIAVAANHLEDTYAGRILQGVFQGLYAGGYEGLVFSWDEQVRSGAHILRSMGERRVDGLLMFPPAVAPTAEYMAELAAFQKPIVLVDQTWPGVGFDFVGFDDFNGARAATEHLLELGHRRVANLHYRNASTGRDRFEGYLAAMIARGAAVRGEWVLDSGGTFDAAYAESRRLLESGQRPTAVVCFNDEVALALLAAAADLGIAVPADLSVVGFADLPMAAQVRPALTSVRQDAEKLGQRAVQVLLDHIADRAAERDAGQPRAAGLVERISTDLVVRGSTRALTPVSE